MLLLLLVDIQARVGRDERSDFPPPMDRATIPEEHDRTTEVP
jgi:hypothetical protein